MGLTQMINDMKLQFTTKPWKHQVSALKFLYPRSFGALYTVPGSGKTKVMIDLIVNRGFERTIIVATSKICKRHTWDTQIYLHAPEGQISVLNTSKIEGTKRADWVRESRNLTKKTHPESTQEVLIINYESVWREPFKSFLLNKYNADCIICDESHKIKSASSKCSKMLQLLGKRTPNRFLMTGTPLSQSPLDIYAQYRFLAPEIFGTRFDVFKNTYSNQIPMGNFTVIDKKNPYKNLDAMHEKMFSCAFSQEVQLDLPETRNIQIDFDLSPETQKYYKEFKKEGVLELSNGTVTSENVLVTITRLQQLCSGYLPVEDDEGNVKYEAIDTARQEAFLELLEGFPENEPVVVFAKYRKDIRNIRRIVASIGRKSSEMSGTRDTTHNWLAGKSTVLVVQISSGSEGLNELVKARYGVYYTLTNSLGQYIQSKARLNRPGQTRPVTFYTLVAKMKKGKTIDEVVLEGLAANKNVIDYIMETETI